MSGPSTPTTILFAHDVIGARSHTTDGISFDTRPR